MEHCATWCNLMPRPFWQLRSPRRAPTKPHARARNRSWRRLRCAPSGCWGWCFRKDGNCPGWPLRLEVVGAKWKHLGHVICSRLYDIVYNCICTQYINFNLYMKNQYKYTSGLFHCHVSLVKTFHQHLKPSGFFESTSGFYHKSLGVRKLSCAVPVVADVEPVHDRWKSVWA